MSKSLFVILVAALSALAKDRPATVAINTVNVAHLRQASIALPGTPPGSGDRFQALVRVYKASTVSVVVCIRVSVDGVITKLARYATVKEYGTDDGHLGKRRGAEVQIPFSDIGRATLMGESEVIEIPRD